VTFQTPLKWPQGWERSAPIGRMGSASQFKASLDKTADRLYHELGLFRARDVVISSDLPLNMRGQPYSNQARMKRGDPGVALYFTRNTRQYVMARDVYDNVQDNLHSLLLAIEGLRQMERHGGGTMLERAFEGFQALPDQSNWRVVLGFTRDDTVTLADAERHYREGAKLCHADSGGSHEAMVKLNVAIAQARQELK